MSYLLGAYGFAIAVLVGYVFYISRLTRSAAERLRDVQGRS